MTPEMRAYVALLQVPHTSAARHTSQFQTALAFLRDYIAGAFGTEQDAEIVQNIFEAIAATKGEAQ